MTSELLILFVGFILFIAFLLLLYDRWVIIDTAKKEKERLLDELSRMTKALISKNANDYVMTTAIDKAQTEEKELQPTNPDEIPEESLSDDEFFKAIGETVNPKKK